MKQLILPVTNGDVNSAIRNWLKGLLTGHRLDALLIMLEQKYKEAMTVLVSDPEMLQYAHPLAPVMPRNAAQMVSRLTRIAPPDHKIGVVLKPCEARALVELVKLKQANLENIVIIGVDCPGTVPVSLYKNEKVLIPEESQLRTACRVCEYPSPIGADLIIGTAGATQSLGIILEATGAKGEELLSSSPLGEAGEKELTARNNAIEATRTHHIEARDKLFERLNNEIYGLDNLVNVLSACTGCHNCRIMCPICYCRECFFDSPTFDREAEKYFEQALRKGAGRLPSDTLLYHLTRLNHMVTSCVACGMCSQACPNDIPVFEIFKIAGYRVQEEFKYVPGRDPDEELPLSVFKEDELPEIG